MPTNEILHKGWLLKSPPDRRNWFTFSKRTSPRWRRRFFCLYAENAIDNLPTMNTKAGLNYYKQETDNINVRRSVGSIDLSQCEEVCTVEIGENATETFAIRTKHKGRDRVYHLRAETKEEMQQWMDCLCTVLGLKENSQNNQPGDQNLNLNTSEGYIHIDECYSGPQNDSKNPYNQEQPQGIPASSTNRLNVSASGLPTQQSPRSRRSSVPARPSGKTSTSSGQPSLPHSQLDLRSLTPTASNASSSQRQLAQVPPSPLDAAPKQMAPSRPTTQYDVLPPMTNSVSPLPTSHGATYDTLPKPAVKPLSVATNSIYDRPPIGPSATTRNANYDVLPVPAPPSGQAPAAPIHPAPPTGQAPAAPVHPAVPSSPAPKARPSANNSRQTDYDLLPTSPSTAPTSAKPKSSSITSYGYDQLPPVVQETGVPSTTSNNATSYGITHTQGKRRAPMLLQKNVPPVPVNPQQTQPQCGYINLNTSPKKSPSHLSMKPMAPLPISTPANINGNMPPSISDLPPSQPPPPPPGVTTTAPVGGVSPPVTQDDVYDYPTHHGNAIDTFADDKDPASPPAPCLVLHKYVNAPSGFMSDSSAKHTKPEPLKISLSMDVPIEEAPAPPSGDNMQNSSNMCNQDQSYILPKAVENIKSGEQVIRKRSFKRILPVDPNDSKDRIPKILTKHAQIEASSDESEDSYNDNEDLKTLSNTVQYLDLDHENTTSGSVSPVPNILRSETNYNEIDFEKTEILTKMRRDIEIRNAKGSPGTLTTTNSSL